MANDESQNPKVEVPFSELKAILEILNEFEYEADEDSCTGMSFFKARLNEDWFFHVKNKLEAALRKD